MANFDEVEFNGKVFLVTATTGIARAVVFRLCKAGASVVALGIDKKANDELKTECAKQGISRLALVHGDVTKSPDVLAALQEAEKFGGLDGIVNSAAIHPYGDVVETDWATWERTMAVNIGGVYQTAHAGIALLRKRGGGAIVNLASVQGYACQKRVAAYATTKGAIHTLTRAMALDFAKDKIRVNSVSPGSVRTPILENAARSSDGPGANLEAVFARYGAAHPLGRIGEPEEIADLIAYLLSPRAAFITGADFVIDGGLKAGLGVS